MEQFVRRALAQAEEVGNPRALALCYNALGAVQYLLGRWLESVDFLQRSIELARSVRSTFGEVIGLQRLGLVETGLGRHEAAYEHLCHALTLALNSDSAMVRYHGTGRVLIALARNRFEAGDLALATEYLARGFAAQQEAGQCLTCDVLLYPVAVPLYIALDDLTLAEQACRKAEETATAFRSQAWVATARYLRGLFTIARSDWHVAVDCLQEALERFEALPQPYDVARSLEALADVATKASPSLPHLSPPELRQRALEVYLRLGAQPDVERLSRPLA